MVRRFSREIVALDSGPGPAESCQVMLGLLVTAGHRSHFQLGHLPVPVLGVMIVINSHRTCFVRLNRRLGEILHSATSADPVQRTDLRIQHLAVPALEDGLELHTSDITAAIVDQLPVEIKSAPDLGGNHFQVGELHLDSSRLLWLMGRGDGRYPLVWNTRQRHDEGGQDGSGRHNGDQWTGKLPLGRGLRIRYKLRPFLKRLILRLRRHPSRTQQSPLTPSLMASDEREFAPAGVLILFPGYWPAMVRPSRRMVGAATEPRNSRSFPISVMLQNMSFKFPATVISSTG